MRNLDEDLKSEKRNENRLKLMNYMKYTLTKVAELNDGDVVLVALGVAAATCKSNNVSLDDYIKTCLFNWEVVGFEKLPSETED